MAKKVANGIPTAPFRQKDCEEQRALHTDDSSCNLLPSVPLQAHAWIDYCIPGF